MAGAAAVSGLGLWSRPVRAARRHVLLLGDSMIAGAVGRVLEQRLRGELGWKTTRQGKTSSGLARPDFYDWIAEGRRAREAAAPVDAVVVMLGGNDAQGLYRPKKTRPTPDAKWIRWGQPEWMPEYRERVRAFCEAVTAGDEQLFWIGMPVMGVSRLHARMQELNALFVEEMGRRDATFIDIWPTLADDAGDFVERKALAEGQPKTRIRAHDGIHLNTAGATLVVDEALPIMKARLG